MGAGFTLAPQNNAKPMIQLKKDPSSGEETMCFLNCSSPFPKTPGLHISASSCGSGKTTIISEIAKIHASDGVLIVVPTIEAATELYRKLPTAYVLHSGNIGEMESYRNNPTGLMMKNILVITSARLIIDPVELFLEYGFGKKRKYVLIDELINFYPEPYSIPQTLSDALTYIDRTKTHKTGHTVGSIEVDGKTYYRHTYGTIGELMAAYKSGLHKLFKGKSNALAEYKTNHILQHVLSDGLSPIQQKVIDIAQDHIVILFDGTADIVFDKDMRMLPLSGTRYGSDIEFIRFPMPIKRKNKEGFRVDDFDKYASDLMKMIADITKNEKLLVVTWKTLDVFKNDLDADKLENLKVSIDGFPERLKEILVRNGAVESNLRVIYRGSGQDRGSNEYRDFESIMFLGEWLIPDNITGDINSMFGCKCKFEDYKKSLIVQTICRLQIRKHEGLPIKVYFSEDIDYNLMWEVQEYFKANSNPSCKIKGLTNPCPKYKRPEKGYMIDIAFLEGYDGNIRNAIENNRPYSFNITLDDLFSIIPKDRKAKGRYNNLIRHLKDKLQITMNIK